MGVIYTRNRAALEHETVNVKIGMFVNDDRTVSLWLVDIWLAAAFRCVQCGVESTDTVLGHRNVESGSRTWLLSVVCK